MSKSKKDSEWWDESWNPTIGCSKVSESCVNCYAEQMAKRLAAMGRASPATLPEYMGFEDGWTGEVTLCDHRLEQPLHWRNPRRIFVCSMSDLFHPKVPFEFIEKVFCIIKQCPQHTFLILTKRPQRMLEFYKGEWCKENSPTGEGPIPDDEFNNIQIGTTVENQPRADERVIQLLPIPAAVRFVSCTLMGPIDFQNIDWNGSTGLCTLDNPPCQIKWVIIECERLAGNRAGRGCEDEALWWQWAKDIYEQCRAANVAFWLKQGPKNGKVTDRLEDFPAWARIREYPNNSK